jgi:exodeoxyribonuclease-5
MSTITQSNITLSPDQKVAVDTIERWLDRPSFRRGDLVFSGNAGTGKSTCIAHLYPRLKAEGMLFMAPTGKAADILRKKSMEAVTVHAAIYYFKGLHELPDGNERPIFEDREEWKGTDPRLLACDESSMVNYPMYRDITSKGISCLWVGDDFQLPPVGEDPHIMQNAHIKLEKIHRQAEGSYILRMAHAIRQGNSWSRDMVDNKSTFMAKLPTVTAKVGYAIEHGITQSIVSFNKTRHAFNKIYRAKTGKRGALDVGDRIVITHNDWNQMLFNGQLYTVTRVIDELDTYVRIDMRDELGIARKNVTVQKISLGNPDYKKSERIEEHLECDYGNAVTCHRMQGDSSPRVMYVDEPCKLWDMARHRYTGITRAVDEIHIVV